MIRPSEKVKNTYSNIAIQTCVGEFEGYTSMNIYIENLVEAFNKQDVELANTATVTLVQL